jgi:hypothetical protein
MAQWARAGHTKLAGRGLSCAPEKQALDSALTSQSGRAIEKRAATGGGLKWSPELQEDVSRPRANLPRSKLRAASLLARGAHAICGAPKLLDATPVRGERENGKSLVPVQRARSLASLTMALRCWQ